MLLACDIGNTSISIGIFKGGILNSSFDIATNKNAKADYYRQKIRTKIPKLFNINKVVIASVVPAVNDEVFEAFQELTGVNPKILTNTDVPVKNKYAQPNKVGTDRLLDAFAAIKLYKPPIIIVDFGTATTFDAVSMGGEYLGGAITPGIETSLEALFGKASKLESVELKKPSKIIGQTTEESIRSGVVIGSAGLIDKMIIEIEKEIGRSTKIATGGLADLIIPFCDEIDIIEKHLTLRAIVLL